MEFSDDDLFAVANSIAELLGAPVTIEDQDTIVVAYSGGEQAVDEARIGTILARQVPLRYRTALTEAGVFERLNASDEVIYVDLPQAQMTPRAVVAVRDNGLLLGSIWAAVPGTPSDEQERVLRSAAPIVARLIGRERERSNASRRERRDVVTKLLAGGSQAAEAARGLGLRPPLVVAAIAGPDDIIESNLASSVALHLGAVVPRSVSAHLGDTTYAVVGADETQARRILKDFLARSRKGGQLTIGLGRQVDEAHRIDVSRTDADLVLRAMLHTTSLGEVGTMNERFADVLAVQMSSFVKAHADLSPLTVLIDYDLQHDTHLVEAVRAILGAGGDVARAAEEIHVHPNTMRNRIRRAAESCGVDLGDPDTRLALMLHLKVEDIDPQSDPDTWG
ncbi:MAG: helix-turn-helix domain-containing protein [Aeromicrobium sp.]